MLYPFLFNSSEFSFSPFKWSFKNPRCILVYLQGFVSIEFETFSIYFRRKAFRKKLDSTILNRQNNVTLIQWADIEIFDSHMSG